MLLFFLQLGSVFRLRLQPLKEKTAPYRTDDALSFSFVCLFGAGVTAVLFLSIKCRIDFFADWTFLIHFIPPFDVLIRVQVLKPFLRAAAELVFSM